MVHDEVEEDLRKHFLKLEWLLVCLAMLPSAELNGRKGPMLPSQNVSSLVACCVSVAMLLSEYISP